MSRLYEIVGDLLTLQEMLEDSVDNDQCLADTLEAVQGEYEVKLEAYCKIIKNLEADVDALKAEVDRLTVRRKTLENNIERLKKSMYDSMKATDTAKVKGQLFTVSIQKNGGKIPVVVDVDTAALPDEFVRIVESPDLDAIRQALESEADNEIKKLAHLGERGESLRIK